MALPPREAQIVAYLDHFKQASTAQLERAVFPGSASRTSCDRALKRLLRGNYIRRLDNRRLTRSDVGGSGPLVYRLGPAGWKLCEREGRWRSEQAVDEHALDIVDAFVSVFEAEQAGLLGVRRYVTEPRCWFTSRDYEGGDVYLEPDLLLEIETSRRVVTWWLEVDRGHQNPERHVEKMERYADVYRRGFTDDEAAQFEGGAFPRVVFVMNKPDKRETLARVIRDRKYPAGMFAAVMRDGFPASVL